VTRLIRLALLALLSCVGCTDDVDHAQTCAAACKPADGSQSEVCPAPGPALTRDPVQLCYRECLADAPAGHWCPK